MLFNWFCWSRHSFTSSVEFSMLFSISLFHFATAFTFCFMSVLIVHYFQYSLKFPEKKNNWIKTKEISVFSIYLSKMPCALSYFVYIYIWCVRTFLCDLKLNGSEERERERYRDKMREEETKNLPSIWWNYRTHITSSDINGKYAIETIFYITNISQFWI